MQINGTHSLLSFQAKVQKETTAFSIVSTELMSTKMAKDLPIHSSFMNEYPYQCMKR